MLDRTQTPLATLAANINALLARDDLTQRELARRARIKDPKNVSNLCRAAHNPKLDTIEKIARVFGLEAWELLRPGAVNLPRTKPGELDRLTKLYQSAPEGGRETVMQVAEIAAGYGQAK
jgi:transcriptional regulator with XRE-family HTH domain